ncbi:MAG TPA: AzlD domain-containing protein [Trueperaceae bacterium]
MTSTFTILLMALVTYLPRLAGFMLAGSRVPPFWLRFLRFVPISVFAVLIVPALPGAGGLGARAAAAAVAGLLMWRRRSLALGLLGGLATFYLLRML